MTDEKNFKDGDDVIVSGFPNNFVAEVERATKSFVFIKNVVGKFRQNGGKVGQRGTIFWHPKPGEKEMIEAENKAKVLVYNIQNASYTIGKFSEKLAAIKKILEEENE
jgi:hypothetical protein